jgi:hypothetical protein
VFFGQFKLYHIHYTDILKWKKLSIKRAKLL